MISFGENVFYNALHSMRKINYFKGSSINDALTALTVKVGREHPGKVKVRTRLPVIWVYWSQAKVQERGTFCLAPSFSSLTSPCKANIR